MNYFIKETPQFIRKAEPYKILENVDLWKLGVLSDSVSVTKKNDKLKSMAWQVLCEAFWE